MEGTREHLSASDFYPKTCRKERKMATTDNTSFITWDAALPIPPDEPRVLHIYGSRGTIEAFNAAVEQQFHRKTDRANNIYDPMKYSRKWLKPARRSGNTTRQADRCIQALFRGKKVRVIDHHLIGRSEEGINHLYDVVIGRLGAEHGIPPERIKWDLSTKIMELECLMENTPTMPT